MAMTPTSAAEMSRAATLRADDMTIATRSPLERWENLLPPQGDGFDDAYSPLSPEQITELALLARMVRLLETGKADAHGGMARHANQIRQAFARDGLDADWLLSQREAVRQNRIQRSRNASVDGRAARLLGAMLPLSWDGDHGVTEFLLTVALGKCSHMPPPPFNQVAHVIPGRPIDVTTLGQQQGTSDPWVWVEGTIRYGISKHVAYRVDGMLHVEAAYSIEPKRITPASAVELADRAEQARQESEALLYPSLTDLVTRE